MGSAVGDGRERSNMKGAAEISGAAYMKAAVCDRCGPPEVIQIAEVEKPVPKDDEV